MRQRPRLCWFCKSPGVDAVQELKNTVTLRLNGSRREGSHWESRFVCAAHRALDPWEA